MQTNTVPTAPVPPSYGGNKAARTGLLSRGPVGIIVIALHVVLIYVIAASIGIMPAPKFAKPMEALIIETPQEQKAEPVKVIKPDLEQPPVVTPPVVDTIPEIEVPTDEPAPAAITAAVSDSPPAVETADMKVNKRVDPVYPPASRRAGEEGTGMFRVLVDEKGHPIEVSVLKTSGFPKLDEAAMIAIKRWAFSPAMQNSQPVQSWTRVAVKFQLNNG